MCLVRQKSRFGGTRRYRGAEGRAPRPRFSRRCRQIVILASCILRTAQEPPAEPPRASSLKVQTAAAFVALMRDLGEETHTMKPP